MTIKTEANMTSTPTKVETFVDPDRIAKDVATNPLDLAGELCRQSGLVYYYTSMAAKAERQHSTLKLRLETVEAQVASLVRKEATEASPPEKLTVAQIDERVRLHPKVLRIEGDLIEAKEVETVLKGVVTALRDKSQSLTSLTNMTRDEIRAKLAVEQDLAAQVNAPLSYRDKGMKDRLRESIQAGTPSEV